MLDFTPGMGQPGCAYRLGNYRLVSRPMEKDLGALVDGKLNASQQYMPWQPKGTAVPWVRQAQHCHQMRTLLCAGTASDWKVRLGIRKRFCTRGQRAQPQAAGVQGAFEQHSDTGFGLG